MLPTWQETPSLLTRPLKIRKLFGVPSETSSTNSQLPTQPPSPEPLGASHKGLGRPKVPAEPSLSMFHTQGLWSASPSPLLPPPVKTARTTLDMCITEPGRPRSSPGNRGFMSKVGSPGTGRELGIEILLFALEMEVRLVPTLRKGQCNAPP